MNAVRARVAPASLRMGGTALLLVVLLLGGCRESERDRPLRYQKGTYSGTPHQELGAPLRERLRHHHRRQNFGL